MMSARPLHVVESVFRSLHWRSIRSDEESVVEVAFADSLVSLAAAFVFEDEHRFVFLLHLATPAPKDRSAEVLEFIARANHGLVVGNWEMNVDSGEIRFRVGVDYGDQPFSGDLLVSAIRSAMKTTDIYQEAFQRVLEGRQGAYEAIETVEAGRS